MECMGLTQGKVTLTNVIHCEGVGMTEGKKGFSRSSSGEPQGEEPLTNYHEKEIVQLVALGYGNKEIGQRLSLDEQIVNDYIHGIFDKFGVSDRLELTLYAIQNHLLRQH
jgi:DNA-binding NarL/FixJ family response regulator